MDPGCRDPRLQLNYNFESAVSPRLHHRRRKGSVVGGHHVECGARAYNGGLGAEPPAESRGRALGQGVRGEPTEVTTFRSLDVQRAGKLTTITNLSYRKQYALLRSTGVRVGGPECMVPPNPVIIIIIIVIKGIYIAQVRKGHKCAKTIKVQTHQRASHSHSLGGLCPRAPPPMNVNPRKPHRKKSNSNVTIPV